VEDGFYAESARPGAYTQRFTSGKAGAGGRLTMRGVDREKALFMGIQSLAVWVVLIR